MSDSTSDAFEIFSFDGSRALAEAVGAILEVDVHPIEVHRFPDGESLVHAHSTNPGRALVFRSLDQPNEKIFELLLAADALRRQGVQDIELVAPYLGYMRQDKAFHEGEAVSQQVLARLLDAAYDGVLTVEAHLHRIERLSQVFSCRADSISAAEPIALWLGEQPEQGIVIGPDSESEPWVRSIAERAGIEWVVSEKTRFADHDVRIELPELPADTRVAWIVDDIASSGATLETLIRILKTRGVERVGAIIVHALLDEATPARLARVGLDRLVSTDSIVHPTSEISLAPLLAETISQRLRSAETA
jgi:ribose-phosphate pyrophosphokinase